MLTRPRAHHLPLSSLLCRRCRRSPLPQPVGICLKLEKRARVKQDLTFGLKLGVEPTVLGSLLRLVLS
ncbi:hypothetical protein F383_36903 [Gossypium arboreum]|uniref:Uncharacterized protein n=1 Tax=Gossypium arboreum TaxID=29729 RepID=A0A0B0MDE7_GOSAR|nr:hypothetical protein F383_36903 [Gossypium arboreum]